MTHGAQRQVAAMHITLDPLIYCLRTNEIQVTKILFLKELKNIILENITRSKIVMKWYDILHIGKYPAL
jgi:hypothetical protein